MLPPDVCEQYYYGTLQVVGGIQLMVTRTADDAANTAFDVADVVFDVARCTVWKDCP